MSKPGQTGRQFGQKNKHLEQRKASHPRDQNHHQQPSKRDAKQNKSANHLLNFKQSPRSQRTGVNSNGNNIGKLHQRKRAGSDAANSRVRSRTNYYLNSSSLHRFKLVAPVSHDETDAGTAWPSVCSIVEYVDSADPPRCPICLDFPVGPVSPICGHFFCSSCILRSISCFSQENPKKANECPVCHHENLMELRPVEFKFFTKLKVGGVVSFRKVEQRQSRFEVIESAESYQKFVDGLCADIDASDVENKAESVSLMMNLAAKFVPQILPPTQQHTPPQLPQPSPSSSFYYQATDCQPAFLAPFTLSILNADCDCNNTSLPAEINNVKIVEVTSLTIDSDQSRRRVSFLDNFLPRNASLYLVDANVNKIISPTTHAKFKKRIEDRARQRALEKKRIIQEERKAKYKGESETRKRLSAQRMQQHQFETDSFFHPSLQGVVGGGSEFVNDLLDIKGGG